MELTSLKAVALGKQSGSFSAASFSGNNFFASIPPLQYSGIKGLDAFSVQFCCHPASLELTPDTISSLLWCCHFLRIDSWFSSHVSRRGKGLRGLHSLLPAGPRQYFGLEPPGRVNHRPCHAGCFTGVKWVTRVTCRTPLLTRSPIPISPNQGT